MSGSVFSRARLAWPSLLRHPLVACLVQAALIALVPACFQPQGTAGLFHPASGWALAVLLLGGRRRAWGLLAASVLAHGAVTRQPLLALALGLAQTAGPLAAWALLSRDARFDTHLHTVRHYGRLVLKGVLPLAAVSGLIAAPGLLAAGSAPLLAAGARGWLSWGMGEALGALLVTPWVLLACLRQPRAKAGLCRPEAWLLLGLFGVLGYGIFLGGFEGALSAPIHKAWLLPLLVWATVRTSRCFLMLALCVIAAQAMLDFNAKPLDELSADWTYVMLVSLLGIYLSTLLHEMRQITGELRIAASAFECQEGMIVTDARRRILRTNRSFTTITGYTEAEVLGQDATFMRSDRHPAGFWDRAWHTVRERGYWSDEVWHRRKNGEVFPQQMAVTAVRGEDGDITNFVITHTDISWRRRKESEWQARHLAQRDALVREVHHRIKNNLQGITGLLRQFTQAHPEVTAPMNQAIGQVQSIAIIHGLQGRSSRRTVRLCELTREIALDLARLWHTPVRVDIPLDWRPCTVAETEAVPLALVLNELVLNALKHGRQHGAGATVALSKGEAADHVHVRISNAGVWRLLPAGERDPACTGLELVDAMLPRHGAQLLRSEDGGTVHVLLMLSPPTITLETHAHATDASLAEP